MYLIEGIYFCATKYEVSTNLVEDIEMSEKLISDITQGLELDRNIAKKV
jgi:hypothetical protein